MINICCTGGRDYKNSKAVAKVLVGLNFDRLGVGDCPTGLDLFVRTLYPGADVFNADWDKFGKAAGPIRNRQMLETIKPDLLIAFPGGRGTEDCIKQAESMGILVLRVLS